MLLRNKNGHCFIILFSCTETRKKRNNHYDGYTYKENTTLFVVQNLSLDMKALLKILNETTNVVSEVWKSRN